MLLLIGLPLVLVILFMILLMPALWGRSIYNEYRDSRAVTCPENGQQVAVRFDALHAAATGLKRVLELRLSDCSRWPKRRNCGRECMPEALRTGPYTRGEVEIRTKRIYHLPILLAAFAGWYLGAVWHSQQLFRARWMADLALTSDQLREIVLWYSPHLLSAAVCLLFAYGVAWLLALRKRKGVGQGIVTSIFLWGAVVLASLPSVAGISRDLLMIEASCSLLVAFVVGALIGGLTGKLVVSTDSTTHAD